MTAWKVAGQKLLNQHCIRTGQIDFFGFTPATEMSQAAQITENGTVGILIFAQLLNVRGEDIAERAVVQPISADEAV